VLDTVATLQWQGPTGQFDDVCALLRDPALADRARALAAR
jgi:hypothetical protein